MKHFFKITQFTWEFNKNTKTNDRLYKILKLNLSWQDAKIFKKENKNTFIVPQYKFEESWEDILEGQAEEELANV